MFPPAHVPPAIDRDENPYAAPQIVRTKAGFGLGLVASSLAFFAVCAGALAQRALFAADDRLGAYFVCSQAAIYLGALAIVIAGKAFAAAAGIEHREP